VAGSVKQLILDIVARDQASATLKKVGDSADQTGKQFDGLGKMAAKIGGITAITAFGISSVKAFADAEAAQSQLQLAFAKFPALADTNIGRLQALNAAMQDKAAIDGDSLAAADAVLARFKLTGTEIEKLTPLLVDYATVTGKDAPAAAETLGKALMGNARALKELGIQFTPTGDRAADLATIMGLLEEKVGGAGEAFAQTAGGQIKSLGLAFEDLQEAVGETLMPALSDLLSVARPFASAFGALPEPVRAVAVAIGMLGAAAIVAGPKMLELKAAVAEAGGMGTVMQAAGSRLLTALTSPWTAGIAVVAGALGIWAQYQAEAKARVDELTGAFRKQGQAGQEAAAQILATNLAPYADTLKALGSSVGEATVAMLKGGDAARQYAAGLQDKAIASTDMASGDRTLIQTTDELIGKVNAEGDAVDESRAAAAAAASAKRDVAAATAEVADAMGKSVPLAQQLSKGFKDTATAAAALSEAFDELNGVNRDFLDAKSDLLKTLDDARAKFDALKNPLNDTHTGFRLTTQAGRDANGMFNDIAESAEEAATAAANKGKWGEAKRLLDQARDTLIQQAEKWGMSEAAAKAYVDQILAVPPKVSTMIEVSSNIATVKALFDSIRSKVVTVSVALHGFAGFGGGFGTGGTRSTGGDFVKVFTDGVTSGVRAVAVAAKAVGDTATAKLAEAAPQASLAGALFANGFVSGLGSKAAASEDAADKWVQGLKDRIDKRVEQVKSKLDEARSALKQLRADYWSTVSAIQDDMKDYGKLTGFDLGAARSTAQAATQAGNRESEAQLAVQAAQEALAVAATDDERAAATERLAQAEADLAEATKARVDADTAAADAAVTGTNLRKSMAERLQKMKDFAAALKQLKSLGLNGAMIQELLDAGPVDGLEMAKAILDAGLDTITGLNVAQSELDTVSRDIGRFGANVAMPEFAAQVTQLQGQIATLQSKYTELARIQKVVAELHIDGRKLVETLIRYRNEHPGAEMP